MSRESAEGELGGRSSTACGRPLIAWVWAEGALARAAAELLEGEWAAPYLEAAVVDVDLWPSQRAGIAQALWLVQEVGNVLVADATGSGKTRMGAQSDFTVVVAPDSPRGLATTHA